MPNPNNTDTVAQTTARDISARYLTIKELAEKEIKGITNRTIEHWIARNVDRFNDVCVIRRAGRVFIDRVRFEQWMEQGRA